MMLAPPGSPVKDTIELTDAHVGDLAQFKDRYVMMLGDNKVYLDGEMQPASALHKLAGFMGFRHAPESLPATAAPPATPALPESAV